MWWVDEFSKKTKSSNFLRHILFKSLGIYRLSGGRIPDMTKPAIWPETGYD